MNFLFDSKESPYHPEVVIVLITEVEREAKETNEVIVCGGYGGEANVFWYVWVGEAAETMKFAYSPNFNGFRYVYLNFFDDIGGSSLMPLRTLSPLA